MNQAVNAVKKKLNRLVAVKLHNFTAFTAKLCTKFAVKKLTFHRLSFIFSRFFSTRVLGEKLV